MPGYPLGDVLLTRVLDSNRGAVMVRIVRPEPDGADYACSFAIDAPGFHQIAHAMGVDALQALHHALFRLTWALHDLAESQGLEVTWLGSRDLGFLTSPALLAQAPPSAREGEGDAA